MPQYAVGLTDDSGLARIAGSVAWKVQFSLGEWIIESAAIDRKVNQLCVAPWRFGMFFRHGRLA